MHFLPVRAESRTVHHKGNTLAPVQREGASGRKGHKTGPGSAALYVDRFSSPALIAARAVAQGSGSPGPERLKGTRNQGTPTGFAYTAAFAEACYVHPVLRSANPATRHTSGG